MDGKCLCNILGIIDEHINTRTNVGLFDVSHMGRFEVKGPDAYDYIQTLVTNDISKLNDHIRHYILPYAMIMVE